MFVDNVFTPLIVPLTSNVNPGEVVLTPTLPPVVYKLPIVFVFDVALSEPPVIIIVLVVIFVDCKLLPYNTFVFIIMLNRYSYI